MAFELFLKIKFRTIGKFFRLDVVKSAVKFFSSCHGFLTDIQVLFGFKVFWNFFLAFNKMHENACVIPLFHPCNIIRLKNFQFIHVSKSNLNISEKKNIRPFFFILWYGWFWSLERVDQPLYYHSKLKNSNYTIQENKK